MNFMPKLKHINSLNEDIDHMYDEYTSLGYNYEHNILKNVVSQELFMNPLNDTPYRQIERLIEHLINEVKQIKLAYEYALPKHSKYIN